MDNLFYTYAHLREDGTPYYIGKGKGRRAFSKQGRHLPVPSKERILFLKKNLTEREAFRHEVYMIAVFGRKDLGTGILRNLTDGGEGASGLRHPNPRTGCHHTPETREKIRRAHLGKKMSPESIEKMIAYRKGRKTKPCSEERKAKISAANKGHNRPWSEKRREAWLRGKEKKKSEGG